MDTDANQSLAAARLHELDSLRGIAALTVMFGHVLMSYPGFCDVSGTESLTWWQEILLFSPLRVVWAGHQAVIFFFILSGFVLALPFFGVRGTPPYPLYLAKRVLRIYPPYLAAVLAAFWLRNQFHQGSVDELSTWFNESWQSAPTPSAIRDHVMMIGSFANNDFNPVLWSLVHEMRISIAFPLIAWGLIRHEKMILCLPPFFSAWFFAAPYLRYHGFITYDHDFFATLHYSGFFVVGAYLAKHRQSILQTVRNQTKALRRLIAGAALLAYTSAFWLPHLIQLPNHHLNLILRDARLHDWLAAAGVVVMILLSLSSPRLSRFLALRPLVFLGSISYSLYLFHALVLKSLTNALHGTLPMPVISLAIILISVPVSALGWRLIEVPSIELGKLLTKRWKRRSTV